MFAFDKKKYSFVKNPFEKINDKWKKNLSKNIHKIC